MMDFLEVSKKGVKPPKFEKVPKHVAIVMDGNGRWANKRGLTRVEGHKAGEAALLDVVAGAIEAGVSELTVFAFSTENWKRPEEELSVLWTLLRKYIRREVRDLLANGIKLQVIGETERLPAEAQKELALAIEALKNGKQMTLTFALSYGGRAEITHAARILAERCEQGILRPAEITEALLQECLWTGSMGPLADVDLVIRTSGEQRLSNFLLWQASYAEFVFPETLWPDYSVVEFTKSLENFRTRKRRFGGI